MNVRRVNVELQSTEGAQLVIREAQFDDGMDILCWRNDPLVCAMSRQNEPVSEVAHLDWYSRALNDPNRIILVGILDGKRIGVVRFDRQDALSWEVSITIAPEVRGKGLGQGLLGLALRHLYSAFPSASVLAVARLSNHSSLELFRKLGFNQGSDDGIFASLVFLPNAYKPNL